MEKGQLHQRKKDVKDFMDSMFSVIVDQVDDTGLINK